MSSEVYRLPRRGLFWRLSFRQEIGSEKDKPDYFAPSFLGSLELLAYPVLIATDARTFIGAWIKLKTVKEWKTPGEDPFYFGRYLIGNALVVLIAFLVPAPLVATKPPPYAP